jgi:hypothetical protein
MFNREVEKVLILPWGGSQTRFAQVVRKSALRFCAWTHEQAYRQLALRVQAWAHDSSTPLR